MMDNVSLIAYHGNSYVVTPLLLAVKLLFAAAVEDSPFSSAFGFAMLWCNLELGRLGRRDHVKWFTRELKLG